MQTREIEKGNWQGFFDQVSRALRGKLIQIEVDSLELGAQTELDKLSLNGLTYDKKDDAFIISTEQIDHVIRSPQQIFATDGSEGMNSIEVRPADGTQQIVRFTEPLALPPAD
jgi:hypothetical protein